MALTFDGVNDVVDHGDIAALDTPAAFTLAMWCSFDEAGAVLNDGFIGKSATGATSGFCHITNNGGFGFRFFIGATAYNKTTMFASTAYQHLAVVYDGAGAADADRLKVYLDGVLQTATSYTGTIPATATDSAAATLKVGRGAADLGFGAGSFGHLKVWTAALSAGEILQEVYSYIPVRTSGLLVWSPYDTGAVTSTDYSGNANHGTITEATASTGPDQVSYGSRILLSRTLRGGYGLRNQVRRLGPFVPLYSRGV